MNNAGLYLLAGFRTAPHFMERFRAVLHAWLEEEGWTVHSELLFPYGDWSRGAVRQLWEIRRDIRAGMRRRRGRSIGGGRTMDSLLARERRQGEKTILIGHSGGGLAALHAAERLLALEGGDPCPVVMIGSPRVRIPDSLRRSVLYLYAGGEPASPAGPFKPADPVCRLGTFGGWTAGARRWPLWTADKHAPAHIRALPIIGGHADYFREREPFVNAEGRSNLEITFDAVRSWLKTALQPAAVD